MLLLNIVPGMSDLGRTRLLVKRISGSVFSKGDAVKTLVGGNHRPRLCENARIGIIRRSQHRGKPNEAFH
jgi:hypothetical protein